MVAVPIMDGNMYHEACGNSLAICVLCDPQLNTESCVK